MEVPKEFNDEIWDYCRINNIPDINNFMLKLLKVGFTVEKYGATPTSNIGITNVVEKEVIKEVIVEKEIIKEVMISDDVKINELLVKLSDSELNNTVISNQLTDVTKKLSEANEKILDLDKSKQVVTDIYNEKRAVIGSNLLDKK